MKYLIVLSFILIIPCAMAQNKYTLEELKKLPKDSIRSLAISMIKDPDFPAVDFDRMTIRSGVDKESGKEYFNVTLSPSVLVKPILSYVCASVSVDLVTGSGRGRSLEGNGRSNKWGDAPWYKAKRKHKRIMRFIFRSVNRSEKVGDIKDGKLPSGIRMVITERLFCYRVTADSYSTHSYYRVGKITGRISRTGHKHYAHSGQEEEE